MPAARRLIDLVSRAQCVMELFTFVQMGGAHERIKVVELHDDVQVALARFDAAKARCFLPKDRQHLLAVMEAGFGDLQPFNRVVRKLLKERTVVGTGTLQVPLEILR